MTHEESVRRAELATSWGDVQKVTKSGNTLTATIKYVNRGALNEGRRLLTRKGWRVTTSGVVATATVTF